MDSTNTKHRQLISEMYMRYSNDVLRYFMKYVRSLGVSDVVEQAEDMTQDLFMRLLRYEEMIIEETAKSFIFTIARRMVIDHADHIRFVRRATRSWIYENASERFWQDSETLECKQIREMELCKMRSLPKRMAQVYEMTRFENLTAQEIAERIHISKRTVDYHLFMSRREVRSSLRKAINM